VKKIGLGPEGKKRNVKITIIIIFGRRFLLFKKIYPSIKLYDVKNNK
jgi:hypothetical protein